MLRSNASLPLLLTLQALIAGCGPNPSGEDTGLPAGDTDTDTDTDIDTDTGEGADTGVDTGIAYTPHDYDVEGYWGDAPDVATRLAIFDDLWEELGENYASFGASGVDWDTIYDTYRPEIEGAESEGRFFQLLADIFLTLQDGHTYLTSADICGFDAWSRPPIWRLLDSASYTGACLTPLDDDSLLVYRVADDNPVGLAPGDRLIGYEGVPWRDLLEALEPLDLPVCGYHASADLAQDYNWMSALLSNYHLFETLDVVRYGTDEPESVETDVLLGYYSTIYCTDQVAVEGVDFPYTDSVEVMAGAPDTAWGMLEDTNIGYVYVYGWSGQVTVDFTEAIADLMETDGLIIDQRYNTGGGSGASLGGLSQLFDEDVEHIMNCADRVEGGDYDELDISPWGWHEFSADPTTYYDRPIAVLTGPRAISAGDLVPYYMTYHPEVRRFGRTTDGSFGSISSYWYPDPYVSDLYLAYTYAACVDADMNYLQGSEQIPEEEVWLDPDDVAGGVDTVVQAALDWIEEENAAR